MRTRNSSLLRPNSEPARTGRTSECSFRHAECSHDLGDDVGDGPTGGVDDRSRRRPSSAAMPPVPSRRRPGPPSTPGPRPSTRSGRPAASSRCRRRARSSSQAVRNTFTAASGKTTVPMSRPSTTPPPCSATQARWRATSSHAHRRMGRDRRHRAGHLRTPDLGATRRRRRAWSHRRRPRSTPRTRRSRPHASASARSTPGPQHRQRDGAVHRTGVEHLEPERGRDPTRRSSTSPTPTARRSRRPGRIRSREHRLEVGLEARVRTPRSRRSPAPSSPRSRRARRPRPPSRSGGRRGS